MLMTVANRSSIDTFDVCRLPLGRLHTYILEYVYDQLLVHQSALECMLVEGDKYAPATIDSISSRYTRYMKLDHKIDVCACSRQGVPRECATSPWYKIRQSLG